MNGNTRRPIVNLFEGKETVLRKKYDSAFRAALPKLGLHPEILRVVSEVHGLGGEAPKRFNEIKWAALKANLSLPAHAAYAVGLMALVNSKLPGGKVSDAHINNAAQLLPVFTRDEREVMFLRASIPFETAKAVGERRGTTRKHTEEKKGFVCTILDAAG